uniref:C2H2-type domain-containing protein n=1 Tax=Oryzias sinensis TaxID=183150 RepID=A0A8C7WUN2_9TELE
GRLDFSWCLIIQKVLSSIKRFPCVCVPAVLPQHWVTEEDLCNQHRNFRVKLEEPEPPQIKEEQQEPEPPQIKEELQEPDHLQFKKEQDELCISQDEEQLDLKQETDTLLEIPTYEEDENSEADLNNQQIFNVTDSQDEKGSQHEESTSTTDGETDPQNRDQRKRRDRSHVQSVDSSHMSESEFVRKKNRKASFVKKHNQYPTGKRSSYIKFGKRKGIGHNELIHVGTKSERPHVCEDCGTSFDYLSQGRIHMRAHTEGNHFLCKECDKSFSRISNLKRHMRIHTGEKPFACEVCGTSFCQISNLKRHMITHTGE